MLALHGIPRWIAGHKPEQEPLVIIRERGSEFTSKAQAGVRKSPERNRMALHAGKLVFERKLQVEVPRTEHFMYWSVMACNVTDKSLHELGTQAEAFEHAAEVEQSGAGGPMRQRACFRRARLPRAWGPRALW